MLIVFMLVSPSCERSTLLETTRVDTCGRRQERLCPLFQLCALYLFSGCEWQRLAERDIARCFEIRQSLQAELDDIPRERFEIRRIHGGTRHHTSHHFVTTNIVRDRANADGRDSRMLTQHTFDFDR